MITLAMILAVGSLLVSPPGASAAVRAALVLQSASSDSPQTDPPQNTTTAPPTEQKTEPAPDQTQPPISQSPAEKIAPSKPVPPPKAKTTTTSKTAPKKHHPRKKAAAPATDGPTKVIIKNGGAPDPTVQLSPGVSAEQASRQRQSTNLLLSTTESNLKVVSGRQLSASQQDMVNQVREYMKQAKTSADAGDLQRAHNLAFKAKLLSDELAKQ